MRIAVDIDGVLADLLTPWLAAYNQEYDDRLGYNDIIKWEVHEFVKPECGEKVYKYLNDPDFYNSVMEIEGARDGVKELLGLGVEIVYVTCSPPATMGKKLVWLQEHGFPCADTQHYVETCNKGLVAADIMIDDYYKNLAQFGGRWKFMFAQPWNFAFYNQNSDIPGMVRYQRWSDIINAVVVALYTMRER